MTFLVKGLSIITLFSISALPAYNQSPCDLIKEYSLLTCQNNTTKSLEALELFRQLYPTDSLVEDVKLVISKTYLDNGEINKSKEIALDILKKQTTLNKRGFQICPIFYDSTQCRRAIYVADDYREIKYKACIILYQIAMLKKDYYEALYYLNLADTDFASFYWGGFTPSNLRSSMLLSYAEVYEAIGNYDKAISTLVPYILTQPIQDKLFSLLKKTNQFDSLKNRLENLDSMITVEYGVVSENPRIVSEYNKRINQVIRTNSIEDYGYIVYWNFLGQQFNVNGSNEYKTRKQRLSRAEIEANIQHLLTESKEYIRTLPIYKAIVNQQVK